MTRMPLLAAVLLLAGCASVKPVPVRASDTCLRCRRVITEMKLAGEIIDEGGLAWKFRTPFCLAQYLAEHGEERPAAVYVTDWTTGKWLRAETASFVRTTIDRQTNERDYAAFGSGDEALRFARENGESPVNWSRIRGMAAAKAGE